MTLAVAEALHPNKPNQNKKVPPPSFAIHYNVKFWRSGRLNQIQYVPLMSNLGTCCWHEHFTALQIGRSLNSQLQNIQKDQENILVGLYRYKTIYSRRTSRPLDHKKGQRSSTFPEVSRDKGEISFSRGRSHMCFLYQHCVGIRVGRLA